MFWGMFARPSPGSAGLTWRVFISLPFPCAGPGPPALPARVGGRGRGGSGGAGRISRGGTGGTPAGGCRKTILIQKQRPDRPVGALREVGGGQKYGSGREGEKFRGKGIIIIMEVKT